jgi:hypothetical protein
MTPFSLDDLDAAKASDEAFEFEYINKAGAPTGIFFSVFGAESEIVRAETARLQNERRRKAAAREINQKIGVNKPVEYDKFEDDVAYGRQMSAMRLAGWRGITDEFTKENALRLCKSNEHIAMAITQASEEMGNFIKL